MVKKRRYFVVHLAQNTHACTHAILLYTTVLSQEIRKGILEKKIQVMESVLFLDTVDIIINIIIIMICRIYN